MTDAIDSVEFLILVMTPAATTSGNVEKEWRYARQQGVCVYPVKGAPDSEIQFPRMPRWMSKAHFYDLEKGVAHLHRPSQKRSQPVAVLLNGESETLRIASRAGFQCFTPTKDFREYLEKEILAGENQVADSEFWKSAKVTTVVAPQLLARMFTQVCTCGAPRKYQTMLGLSSCHTSQTPSLPRSRFL